MSVLPPAIARRTDLASGVAFCGVVAAAGFAVNGTWPSVSPLTSSLAISVVAANVGAVPAGFTPGTRFASRQLLRLGIVLLGLQLSISQVTGLGVRGFGVIVGVVFVSFLSTRALGRLFGVSDDLSLLTATGFSICGVSAVSAMVGAVDADERDATYAVALVTMFGSISIAVLPLLGGLFGMSNTWFGAWAGSAVHDVAQVVATATAFSHDSLASATIVKLTRVALLAPVVGLVVTLRHRSRQGRTESSQSLNGSAPSLVPGFIVAFIAMVAVRSTGVIPDHIVSASRHLEKVLLAMALVGLGANVKFREMRALGSRPILLGVTSWIVVMSVSFAASSWIPLTT